MIRRSAGLAAIALILSLAAHFLGIGLTFSTEVLRPQPAPPTDAVQLGTSFDEVADLEVEAVAPEPLEPLDPVEPEEPPEPEVQPPEEPPEADVPTSDAQVASSNPQETFAPDTGLAPPVEPEFQEPVSQDTVQATEPEEAANSGGAETGIADAQLAPPVDSAEAPAPQPLANPTPPEEVADAVDTPTETVVPPVAASPQLTAPPVADVIAALPPETTPVEIDELTPDVSDAEEQSQETGAVTASLRPSIRPPDLSTDTAGDTPNAAPTTPQVIESPLTLYSRQGIDLFAGRQSSGRGQSAGASGGLGPGNSDTTNYAGQVLVHLNRRPPVAVAGRGWARVTFRINPDGSLASVDIIDGSGSSDIDRAARLQVRRGEPFPPPPDGRTRTLTFVYSLN